MSRYSQSLWKTRQPTLEAVSDPALHSGKRKKKNNNINTKQCDIKVEYILFDAVTGNLASEDKGAVDDLNLLES